MKEQLKARTKKIGIDIIQLMDELPQKTSSWAISRQLVRSGTSIGANYRAACRAKSTKDFTYKLTIVEEEADETLFWLELLEDCKLVSESRTKLLQKEVNEILSITISSINSLKRKAQQKH